MEELGIPPEDMEQYAKSMADALAMKHWAAGIDGNDVGFVLASPSRDRDHGDQAMDNVLGMHTIWILGFDLCRDMPYSKEGVRQAVTAFFRNDPFYPRPRSSPLLWEVFRKQYLASSRAVVSDTSWKLPSMFVEAIEGGETVRESHGSEY